MRRFAITIVYALIAALPVDNAVYAAGLGVSKEAFGKMPDGTVVEKYTLSNVHGVEVGIITYGATVQSIKVPDNSGRLGDVALGFDNLADYLKDLRYTLNKDNELRIDCSAVTDKGTIVNLTNHTYFNLGGAGNGTILDQVAMINADKFTPVDKTLIPAGQLQEVKGNQPNFPSRS
jgi:galactose mutarotase-like enzyme